MDKLESRHLAILEMNHAASPGAEVQAADTKAKGRSESFFDPLVPTIFHEDWWLDAATGGNFDFAEVTIGGRTAGRLPFSKTSRFGLKIIHMPVLTYFLGPAIDEGEGSPKTRFQKRLEITRELLEKLPPASWQYVKCHGGISTEMIAFQKLGFRIYVQFTYETTPGPVEVLWQQMHYKTRSNICKAEEQFSVTELTDPVEFFRMYQRNLEVKRLKNGIDENLCRNTISASLERQRGRILAVRDKKNQVVAANFSVWDRVSSYYILATRCDNSGNGAISLLLWEAIKESARRGLVFDFGGLGNKGSVRLYSRFGGSISIRYVAVRACMLARILNELKSLLTPENCFY